MLEVQRTDNLHYLVAEMERWRSIIDENYAQYKRANGLFSFQKQADSQLQR